MWRLATNTAKAKKTLSGRYELRVMLCQFFRWQSRQKHVDTLVIRFAMGINLLLMLKLVVGPNKPIRIFYLRVGSSPKQSLVLPPRS